MLRIVNLIFVLCFIGSVGHAQDAEPTVDSEQLRREVCQDALTTTQTEIIGNRWMGKTLIFDTNVLLNDPFAIYKFPGAHVVITGTVLEEIDGKKSDERLGRAARMFAREMIKIIERNQSAKNMQLPNQASLTIDQGNYMRMLKTSTLDLRKKDNELIATALGYADDPAIGKENVFIISDDLNVRVKSFGMGVKARPYELEWVTPVGQQESFVKRYALTDEQMDTFIKTRKMAIPQDLQIFPNEFVTFTSPTIPEPSAETTARYHYNREKPEESGLVQLTKFVATSDQPGAPMNLEQTMALDLLLDPTVDIVIMEAKAGTGKTFLAVLTALATKASSKKYNKILISRPTVHLGSHHPGALPGGIDEKYSEWKMPFLDNYNSLMNKRAEITNPGRKASVSDRAELPSEFQLLPFEFIRGRSIENALILVDEFQNTNVHEAKTVLTRVGKNSKIVIIGNEDQIDSANGYLNATNNGLSVSASGFRRKSLSDAEHSLVGFVKMVDGVRSPAAELAQKVLDSREKDSD